MKKSISVYLDNIKQRIQTATKRQWIAAAIWSVLYILFIVWVHNFWWLLLLPFIVDAFLTKYIPWTFWRKYKESKPTLYKVCSWVDAIVFALIAVYFINLYVFQNYQIPSSSLEKSLKVGDFLYVSKVAYGPRIPNTPFSFPLVQHTFPNWLGGGKSYLERPQWAYRRMPGFGRVKRGDIVVFNFPAGDTVALNMQNPDYYSLCYHYGKEIVHQRKDIFGDIVWRPVDRRENYVKRCVGIPGDRFEIRNNQIYVNGQVLPDHPEVQYNYYVKTNAFLTNADFDRLGISKDDRHFIDSCYFLPLTKTMKAQLEKSPKVTQIWISPEEEGGEVYPLGHNHWTRDNYGPIYIPKAGDKLTLNTDNYYLYERVIRNYEGQKINMRDGVIYINGKATDTYTFKMDYYWMMGDNRHNSADSRYWGFVPEDHIVGKPIFIWLSIDKDKPWFKGHIRWDRMFRSAQR